MKISHIFISAVFICSTIHAFAADLSYDPEWGIGILMPSKVGVYDLAPGMILPENGFRIYELPSGRKYAELLISDNTAIIDDEATRREIADADKIMIGPETFCLKIYETTANYVKVLVSTRKGGYWIANKDITATNFKNAPWITVLLMIKQGLYVTVDEGLNLRNAPSATATKIVTMKTETFILKLTGKTKENWAEAEVVEMDKNPCDGDAKEVNHYTGWVKIIDDKGFPNVWYPVVGC
ncbi:MAG TPA: SH3 domain-containing protein [Spirochaetota bacterium]